MMKLYVIGLGSGYEPEHVARLFFSAAQLEKRWLPARTAPDAVCVRLSGRRLLCGIRQNGLAAVRCVTIAQACAQCDFEGRVEAGACTPQSCAPTQRQLEYAVSKLLYLLLCEATGKRPPWGMLTGVRPVRLIHDMRREGMADADIETWFREKYFVSPGKYKLAHMIADIQRPIMTQAAADPRGYSLYISIPFCPSRCSYCSFVSRTTAESGKLIAPYVDRLCEELHDIAAAAQRNNLHLSTVYIGGGTPTSVSAPQLAQLMQTVAACFDLSQIQEYTVEAGRPDCTTEEKLRVIKENGATRISINPQTLSDAVLQRIGRRHTAQDILDCFATARRVGHTNINMDLIAGLPGDTPEGFAESLAGVMALSPENITVHTLTLKRASNLVIDHAAEDYGDVATMVETSQRMLADGYMPYYLYRQKGTLGNLENTGYTKPGFAGLYNIYIMEEVHTILSAGAGGSTKLVSPVDGRIDRIFNHKYPLEYLSRYDVVQERKKGVDTFYAKYPDLDPKAPR